MCCPRANRPRLVEGGDTPILSGASKTAAFGHLFARRHLWIITNNLALLSLLNEAPGLELVMLGVAFRASGMSLSGPLALEALRLMTADRAVMSSDGGVAGRGLYAASLDQAMLKSLMMQQARQVNVLADTSQLGRAEQTAWAPLPWGCTRVTDSHSPLVTLRLLAEAGAGIDVGTIQIIKEPRTPPKA